MGDLSVHGWLYQLEIRRHFTTDPSDPYDVIGQIETFGVVPVPEDWRDRLFGDDLNTKDHPLNKGVVRSISCLTAYSLRDMLDEDMRALCQKELDTVFQPDETPLTPFDLHTTSARRAVVEIDLECSDQLLRQAFGAWLKSARLELETRSRYAFTGDRGRQWAAAQVLPYIDLTQAAQRYSASCTQVDLAELLFPANPDASRVGHTKDLAERLLSREYLAHLRQQAAQETS